jgi:hypothetical protein
MFPSDWSDKKVNCSHKRRKVNQREELKSVLSKTEDSCAEDGILSVIKRHVNNNKFAPAIPEELQLDHILSSVPYQAMLESLFGSVESAQTVPLVTKAYEESYMREAETGERPCAMGAKCECMFIDPLAPFVGVEFQLQGVEGCGMCVLCCRKTTQKLFYDICYSGKRTQGLIQKFGNLCNQPGEYARECMLICPSTSQWQCMPRPIMSHQRNRYKVHIVAGKKQLQQLRVGYEDFASPSDRV